MLDSPGIHRIAVQIGLRQIGLDGVVFRRPLGIKDNAGCGHGHRRQIRFGAFVASRGRVPSVKNVGIRFHSGRIVRCKFVSVQRSFVFDCGSFAVNRGIVIEKLKLIAVAGVVEFRAIEAIADLCASFRIEREALDFNKLFFRDRISCTIGCILVEKLVFSVQSFNVVIGGRRSVPIRIRIERHVFRRHDIQISSPWTAGVLTFTPVGCTGIVAFLLETRLNIGSPFCFDYAVIIAAAICFSKVQRKFNAVIVHVHNGCAIRRNRDLIGFYHLPQLGIIHKAFVVIASGGMVVLRFAAGKASICVGVDACQLRIIHPKLVFIIATNNISAMFMGIHFIAGCYRTARNITRTDKIPVVVIIQIVLVVPFSLKCAIALHTVNHPVLERSTGERFELVNILGSRICFPVNRVFLFSSTVARSRMCMLAIKSACR